MRVSELFICFQGKNALYVFDQDWNMKQSNNTPRKDAFGGVFVDFFFLLVIVVETGNISYKKESSYGIGSR